MHLSMSQNGRLFLCVVFNVIGINTHKVCQVLCCGCVVAQLGNSLSQWGPKFDPRPVHVDLWWTEMHTGSGFSSSTSDFPCHYHSTSAPYSCVMYLTLVQCNHSS